MSISTLVLHSEVYNLWLTGVQMMIEGSVLTYIGIEMARSKSDCTASGSNNDFKLGYLHSADFVTV